MSGPSDWPLPEDGARFIVPRHLLDVLKKNELTRGLHIRAAGYYPNAAGHYVERHRHTDDLLLYCVGGEGSLQVQGAHHHVGTGDLLMLPKGVSHTYGASADRPWTVYWTHFAGHNVDSFWRYLEFNKDHPVASLGMTSRLTSALEALLQVGSTHYLENSLIYGSNLLREILTLMQMMKAQNRETRSQFSIDAIHAVMRDNLHMELDLDTLARTANMTRHAFCRRYKAMTGVSPYKHYLYLKMKRACHFLDATDQSVTDIAEVMGYSDSYYFSRIFRQIMGMPPSQYRARRYG